MLTRLVLSASLVLSLTLIAPVAYSAPAAVVDETAFDFGYVPQQAKISHVFKIRSVGDDTLKIMQVVPGCGCTKAPLEKSDLAPGESTNLEVVFSTGAYQGRVSKHPKFVTNETSPEHKLEFLSTVLVRPDSSYPLVIQPRILDFSGGGADAPGTLTVRLTNVSESAVSPSLIETPAGLFEIVLPGSIPAGGSAEATIRLSDDARASFEKSFTFQLNDAQASRYTVPVKRTAAASPAPAAPVGQ